MSTPLYSYSPRAGQAVSVEIDGSGDCCPILAIEGPSGEQRISIPDVAVAGEARGILTALHEAAGLPVPIVLDRMPDNAFADWIRVRDGQTVLIDPTTPLTLDGAREFAAALVAAVERAEAEPDPAEVEALAEVLHEARERCGGAGELDRQSARTILTRYTLTERKP